VWLTRIVSFFLPAANKQGLYGVSEGQTVPELRLCAREWLISTSPFHPSCLVMVIDAGGEEITVHYSVELDDRHIRDTKE